MYREQSVVLGSRRVSGSGRVQNRGSTQAGSAFFAARIVVILSSIELCGLRMLGFV